eukprot:945589-Alexandrium_andersonii.AAC.1
MALQLLHHRCPMISHGMHRAVGRSPSPSPARANQRATIAHMSAHVNEHAPPFIRCRYPNGVMAPGR